MKRHEKVFEEAQPKINTRLFKQKRNKARKTSLHVTGQELLDSPEKVFAKAGKYAKIFRYLVLALVMGIGIIFNSCAGYIVSEPAYTEYARPIRPGEGYIWIDGGWRWDIRNHTYVQQHGYWERPKQGRSYNEGHWQTSPRGKSWVKGHWQKQSGREDNRRRR